MRIPRLPCSLSLLILIGLFAVLLIGPLLIDVPPLTDTVDPVSLADADSRFVEIEHVDIHYKEEGRGPPTFVLLHGFGASVFTWRVVMAKFGELGRVVAYDRPAFGLTERPLQWTGQNPYSEASQVAIAIALLDSLKIDSAVWVGNSAGARVAVDVALTYPHRVAALVLVDPALNSPGRWLRPLLQTPQLEHLGMYRVRSLADRGDEAIQRAWHDPSLITPEVYAGYRKPLRANDWDKALWQFATADQAMLSTGSMQSTGLSQLATIPTLVITGADDRIVPQQKSIDLAARIPGSRFVALPDCGHVPQEECPGPFMDVVREFVAQVERP